MEDNGSFEEKVEAVINEKYEDFDPEEIKKMIHEVLDSPLTIEEAITMQEVENESQKMAFKSLKSSCNEVFSNGKAAIFAMNTVKLEVMLLKMFYVIVKRGNPEALETLIEEIKKSKIELKQLNVILKELRKSIKKLERCGSFDCNLRILELTSYIYNRGELTLESLDDSFNKSKMAISGVEFIPSSKNQDELTKTDEKISSIVKTLGLSVKTPSDMK